MHSHLRHRCETGFIERIFRDLATDHDNEYMTIDSTMVQAHQHNAGALKKRGTDQAFGRSRSDLTTKIHAICDALNTPVKPALTPGQDADIAQA